MLRSDTRSLIHACKALANGANSGHFPGPHKIIKAFLYFGFEVGLSQKAFSTVCAGDGFPAGVGMFDTRVSFR